MANIQPNNSIESSEYHHYNAPPEVCSWIFDQIEQLREQAHTIISQYAERYCALVRTNVGAIRYSVGIKLEQKTNDKFSVSWGVGKWQGNTFTQTKKFKLQRNRFRVYYLNDYLANAPIELKALVNETEDNLERIRKLQHKIDILLASIMKYESTFFGENIPATAPALEERRRGATQKKIENTSSNPDDNQVSGSIKEWIFNQKNLLCKEAEMYVSYYWSNNRRNDGLESPSISLGLRIKNNRGNSISIEWFEAKFVGKKVLEKKRFKKRKNVHRYSILDKIIETEPNWFSKLVIDTEEELARIRQMIFILSKIKETFLDYQYIYLV
ncbi:conjugative transfer protein MobI(A/C) [Methylomonas sp. UP202]|uniref:conjugative transfer protein MobI(A/C) n=1 Tax=Methylomonas sp. UP202 TaxID=3040943 RepID=UPI00247B0511|nr:conjugative transfer protein MobI(A/C) [Methylomonas sp. UP202]WGS88676.1 conjugative transfer protein MobI(A/C) [Methylomonas sp. UP202]